MRLSLKARQVAAVTSIVGIAVIVLGGLYVTGVAQVRLDESRARGRFLARAIYHRTREVAAASGDPYAALREDPGLRSILESSAYSPNLTYAAIVDAGDTVIAHSDTGQAGTRLPPRPSLDSLLEAGPWEQLRAIYADDGRTLEIQQPLLTGERRFGTIRIGVSMVLTKADLDRALRPALIAAIAALVASSLFAMLLSQSLLRPIHLIKGGLSRLGRGEFGVKLDLPRDDELGELGGFFNAVSAQLSADRTKLAGEKSTLESVVGRLEDAIAFFTPAGELLFANPAMRRDLPEQPGRQTLTELWTVGHPCRTLIEQTCADGRSRGPLQVDHLGAIPEAPAEDHADTRAGRLVMTHAVNDPSGRIVGVMLMCRDLAYLGEVESTIRYSHKLASLSRLTAGVAHEIKNSLHAMTIHLELVRQQVAGSGSQEGGVDAAASSEHIAVIASTLKRLDDMLQGLLKFTRPEELKLQPAALQSMIDAIMPIVSAEAGKTGVEVLVDCPPDLPMLRADPAMLQQALQNLALNACQAQPDGGRLRIAGRAVRDRFVEVVVEDAGAGIAPEHLDKIFNLYFTTRPGGSGIGLSMVYRTVQLHDGEIEVQSSPGKGTSFRLVLPSAGWKIIGP
ncbi:MAG: zraS 4 [Acidobacteria bacterium]|nr:zraS 4 [Acidobacteriota bacterium]